MVASDHWLGEGAEADARWYCWVVSLQQEEHRLQQQQMQWQQHVGVRQKVFNVRVGVRELSGAAAGWCGLL
jgi:hypothetical protein